MVTDADTPHALKDIAMKEPSTLTDADTRTWLAHPLSPEEIAHREAAMNELDAAVRQLAAKAGMSEEKFREVFSEAYLASSDE